MADGNSIINLGDLARPATVLIEKVSNAVGVLYEPRKIVKKAEAEAKAEKIRAITNIELTEIQQRGMERLVYQEARKQENIEDITAQAAKMLPLTAKTEDLEEDWIAHFFDRCERVSDKVMQSLWSNLLAGEATKPGTYSKRTVDLIASMDKKDAELFTKFCQFTWVIVEPTVLILDVSADIYTKSEINFTSLKHLDSIGLISFESLSGYKRLGFGKQQTIFYFGIPTLAEFANEKDNEMQIGNAIFTQAGKELLTICGATRNQEFYDYVIEKLSNQNICLSTATLKNPFN